MGGNEDEDETKMNHDSRTNRKRNERLVQRL
jgi:hypothetical protein